MSIKGYSRATRRATDVLQLYIHVWSCVALTLPLSLLPTCMYNYRHVPTLQPMYYVACAYIRPDGRAFEVMRLGAWHTKCAFSINKRIAYEHA